MTQAPPLQPGRPAVFRGKNRAKPVQVNMTAVGLEGLDEGCREMGLSKADYIEWLIRKDRGLPLKPLPQLLPRSPLSRQRQYQLRKIAEGKCRQCGKPRQNHARLCDACHRSW